MHQLHIFIFVLAVCHVIYCIVTYALGKTKVSSFIFIHIVVTPVEILLHFAEDWIYFFYLTADEKVEEVGRGDEDNRISVFTRYILQTLNGKLIHLKLECEVLTRNVANNVDPERFRFARDTSFGRRHLNFWSKSTITLWIVCFFRQFFRSVTKVDYLTLRHGFIMV